MGEAGDPCCRKAILRTDVDVDPPDFRIAAGDQLPGGRVPPPFTGVAHNVVGHLAKFRGAKGPGDTAIRGRLGEAILLVQRPRRRADRPHRLVR